MQFCNFNKKVKNNRTRTSRDTVPCQLKDHCDRQHTTIINNAYWSILIFISNKCHRRATASIIYSNCQFTSMTCKHMRVWLCFLLNVKKIENIYKINLSKGRGGNERKW